MVNLVRTRPLRRMTQAELDRWLEDAADILRGNVDHSEFRSYVFALLFYKRISDVYLEEIEKLTEEFGDEELARDPKMHNFIVPEGFLWTDPNDESKSVARTTSAKLGKALNEAMAAIEVANKPKFDKILTTIDFNDYGRLPKDKLVTLINHFSKHSLRRDNVPDDLFGNAYEYLIRDFASKAGKSSGEFYTPKEIAFLLSEMVEPAAGDSICDWASGSGGLLLQCCNYVKKHGGNPNQLFLYAQESNLNTYNISRLNLILHGVKSFDFQQGDSLRTPLHRDDEGKLMQFKRIVMNPPFSLKDWGYSDFENKDTKEISDPYDREVAHLQEAAADLLRICSDPDEARRYFAVVERPELEENEFNLNLPRYIDTFDPEEEIPIQEAFDAWHEAQNQREESARLLKIQLANLGINNLI